MTKKGERKCLICKDCDLVKNVVMVLDHKDIPDLVTYHCENCDYIGSYDIKFSSNTFDKKVLGGHIKAIKDQIQFEKDQIEDRKNTMVYFKNPNGRIKGIDIIKYELEIPILNHQLKFLEKIYYDNYGE